MTLLFFFFNDTATTEIYTLSLHDALPIYQDREDRDNLKQVSKQALAWSVGQAPLFRGGRVNPGLQAWGRMSAGIFDSKIFLVELSIRALAVRLPDGGYT